MKFTKLSLAALAAMSIASSAFAVENVKVDGQVKLWYQTLTTSAANQPDMFERASATGDLVANVGVAGDLTKNVGFGFKMFAVTTLGLENNLVAAEAINFGVTKTQAGNSVLNGDANMPMWLGEAYFTYKAGKTIAKIGRQALDTPLAYTETWNAAPNTFEAAVLINQDIPNVTLVGAYVSRGNGYDNSLVALGANGVNRKTVYDGFYSYMAPLGQDALTAGSADDGGAYAVGAVIKAIPGITLHPVYYGVTDTANALWVDVAGEVAGVKLAGAYANMATTGITERTIKALGFNTSDTNGYSVEASGAVSGVNLAAAYSSIGKGWLPIANTATGFKKTKFHTASILSDGEVAGKPDTTAWKVSASTKVGGFDLGASYGSYSVGLNDSKQDWFGARTVKFDPTEIDVSVGTKLGDVNLTAYYISQTEYTKTAAGVSTDRQAVRVIAAINF